jgi:hypothetical protein
MTQTALNLSLHSLSDEVGTLFAVLKNLVNSGQRSLREACWRLFVVDLFPAHAEI